MPSLVPSVPVSYTHLDVYKRQRHYLDTVVPQLMPIIEKLDDIAKTRTTDSSLAIIDQNQVVHMAHMDIHFSHSTNGCLLYTSSAKEPPENPMESYMDKY